MVFADKWRKSVQVLGFNNLFLFVICLLYLGHYTQNKYLIGITMILMGVMNSSAFALNLAIVGEEGWGKRGYTIFNLGECSGVAGSVILFLVTHYNIEVFFMYMVACQIVSSISLHSFR